MQQIYRAILVDDEPSALDCLSGLLRQHSFIEIVGMFSWPRDAIDAILLERPDLIFLDIQMPQINGFELVRELHKNSFSPLIIFTTAHNTFAIEAIRHSAFDYLLKPIEIQSLQAALYRLPAVQPSIIDAKIDYLLDTISGDKRIRLDSSGSFVLVKPDDIIYCEADFNYTTLFLITGDSEVVSMNIGKLEEELPSSRFYRINRSVIINTEYLHKVSRITRKCVLRHETLEFSFIMPRANIRQLEDFIKNN
jgi:two-component system LytT family response regulator